MSIRLPAAVAAAVMLAGCAGLRGVVTTADVAVATPCVQAADVPARPELLADAVWARTSDPFERARALLVDRLRLLRHAGRLESLIQACVE